MAVAKKKRVFQVAREFNISNEALIEFLQNAKYDVKNHMSIMSEEMYDQTVEKFSERVDPNDNEYDFKRELKEKKAKEEAKKLEEQKKYEEKVRTSEKIRAEKPGRRKVSIRTEAPEEPPADIEKEKEEVKKATPKKKAEVKKPAKAKEPDVKPEKEEETFSPDAEEAVKELISKDLKKKEADKGVKKEAREEKPAEQGADEEKKEKKPQSEVDKILKATEKKKDEAAEPAAKKKPRKIMKAKERLAEIEKKEKEEPAADAKKSKKKKKKEGAEEPAGKAKSGRHKKKRKKKIQVSEEEVAESIRQTFAKIEESGKGKRRRKKVRTEDDAMGEEDALLKVHEFITVNELALEMEVEASDVIKKCMELGLLVSINHRLDEATIGTVADEFGYDVEIVPEFGSELIEDIEDDEDDKDAVSRPPVVTIMGHVDHGKTSLLDFIRESNITMGESGGITQHIGAYEVTVNGRYITFLDTPGHEAFAAMRARGAQATDIVILVVAADDNVMPQTIEAINHAKAAEVPIVVAINKIDKPNADIEKIKKQLADHEVLIESWGGKYQSVEISAKTGQNVEQLLESILIEAEILELKANPDRHARGIVIESRLDKGKGVVATVLVQKGNLKIGDPFVAGQYSGKVRSLFNYEGTKIKAAGPSKPAMVLGFNGLPQAGDSFIVLESEKDTKEISFHRQLIKREQDFRRVKHLTLDEISRRIRDGEVKELSIIIKGDVDGSVEAIGDSLEKLSNEEVAVSIVHKGVGAISESDVLLAIASDAVILGFQVRPTINARELAQRENIDIRLYNVIYDAISDVKDALEGLLEPDFEERNLSVIEVRETFRVPKIGVVAGCYVVSGKVTRNDKAKLFRDDKQIHSGKISTLKRFKDDAKEVVSGFECGLSLEGYDDIKVGDIIETYKVEEIKRKLTYAK